MNLMHFPHQVIQACSQHTGSIPEVELRQAGAKFGPMSGDLLRCMGDMVKEGNVKAFWLALLTL